MSVLLVGFVLGQITVLTGHLSGTGRFAFSLPALTLLQLLALLRVDGKLHVRLFQNFSSVPFFPFHFGTVLSIAPNRPDYLTTHNTT